MNWLLCVVASYLCGSIPFGYMLGRLKGIDIREHGSRNVGATNVGRVLGRRLGLLCFALDAGKGAAPVIAAGVINDVWGRWASELTTAQMGLWFAVAVAALLGHMFSPWLKFRGGKGVATGFGALTAMWPIMTLPALLALFLWIVTLIVFRYVSLASIVAAGSLPVTASIFAYATSGEKGWRDSLWLLAGICSLLAALVIYKHRTNISRLRRGVEPKVKSRRRG